MKGLKEFSCKLEHAVDRESSRARPQGKIGADGNRGFGHDGQVVPDLPLGSIDSTRGTAYWLYRKNKSKPSDLPVQVK